MRGGPIIEYNFAYKRPPPSCSSKYGAERVGSGIVLSSFLSSWDPA